MIIIDKYFFVHNSDYPEIRVILNLFLCLSFSKSKPSVLNFIFILMLK